MGRLQRHEIWEAILSKYPSLEVIPIDKIDYEGKHIKRDDLIKIMVEMKIPKSRHLTKDQKARFLYEAIKKL